MSYDGGKGGSGVWQKIISMMPPHSTYIEPFVGGGSVLLRKRPAEVNIAIDLDTEAVDALSRDCRTTGRRDIALKLDDALGWLQTLRFRKTPADQTLIYCDPPYLLSTRSCKQPIYRHELMTDAEHRRLLKLLKKLPCLVMLSGYRSALYDELLGEWRREDFYTTNRRGTRVLESVWLNFPEPLELHDYRWLGTGWRDRERIKKMRNRWGAKLANMPALQRHALMASIEELRSNLAGNGAEVPTR